MAQLVDSVKQSVKKALDSVQFNDISELSKSELEILIAKSIYNVLNSREFERHIAVTVEK